MTNNTPYNLKDILVMIQQLHVPECPDAFDRQLTESDYLSYKETCEKNLICLNDRLKEKLEGITDNDTNCESHFDKDSDFSIVHLLILCGEHSALDYWSTTLSVKTAAEIAGRVLQLSHVKSVTELLLAKGHFIFKNALLILRPKLLSSTWKCNPAAVLSYNWLLMQMKAPFLSEHLNEVLPTALLVTDDFEATNRIKGLQCIIHIVNNVTKADLEMYGYNEVILEALRPILYHNEPDLLESLLKCFVALLRKLELPLLCPKMSRNKCNDIFDSILTNIELEDRNECKIIYLTNLPDMIETFQLRTLRHSRTLFEMIARELNIETTDCINRLLLDVLDAIVKCCWPRLYQVEINYPVLLAILKLIHDLSLSENNQMSNSLLLRIKTSLQLLFNLNKNQLEQVRNDIKNSEQLDEKFKTSIDLLLN